MTLHDLLKHIEDASHADVSSLAATNPESAALVLDDLALANERLFLAGIRWSFERVRRETDRLAARQHELAAELRKRVERVEHEEREAA